MRVGPGPSGETVGSPSGVCPHLGLGRGEGERSDGRWRGWGKGKTSGPRVYVEVCVQGRSPDICVYQYILDCICQLTVFGMYVTICAKIVSMCVLRGAGQAIGTLCRYVGITMVFQPLLHVS